MKLSLRYSLLVGAILGCAARCAATGSSEEFTSSKEFTQLSEARKQLEKAVGLRTDAHRATLDADYKVDDLRKLVADRKRILLETDAECLEETPDGPDDPCDNYTTAVKHLRVALQDATTAKDKETACQPAVDEAYRNVIAKIKLVKEWAASIAGKEVVEHYDLEKARVVKDELAEHEEKKEKEEKEEKEDKEEKEEKDEKEDKDDKESEDTKEKKEKKDDKESEDTKEKKEKKDDKESEDTKEKKEKKDDKESEDKSEKKKSGKARLSSDEDKAAVHEGETKGPKDLADASTVAPPVIKEQTGESALEQKVEKDNSLDNVVADQDSRASFNKPTLVGILSLVSVALFY